jgi:hypothetical protein
MTGVLHALCNAHHLRELKALVEIEKEEWARKMQRLLRRACHAINLARERGVPLNPTLIELFRRRYNGILEEGIAFHEGQPALVRATAEGQRKRRGRQRRRTGHNLLLRLRTRKEEMLQAFLNPDFQSIEPGRTKPNELGSLVNRPRNRFLSRLTRGISLFDNDIFRSFKVTMRLLRAAIRSSSSPGTCKASRQ